MTTITVEQKEASSQLARRFSPLETAYDIDADDPERHLVEFAYGEPCARCSIWTVRNSGMGLIGHYAATSASAGKSVLKRACDELRKLGLTSVTGPVDGSTWKRYRLVTRTSVEKPFFMEPQNPLSWADHFREAGFDEVKSYGSSLNCNLTARDPEASAVRSRLLKLGVSIRSLSLEALDFDLGEMHGITDEALETNFLYTPIPRSTFVENYRRLATMVDRDLVLIAEKEGEIVGYLLSVPDPLDKRTLVMKTIARKKDASLKGLGRLLFDECHERAAARGFKRAIHALYTSGNAAHTISSKYATEIRNYSLFGRWL